MLGALSELLPCIDLPLGSLQRSPQGPHENRGGDLSPGAQRTLFIANSLYILFQHHLEKESKNRSHMFEFKHVFGDIYIAYHLYACQMSLNDVKSQKILIKTNSIIR